MQREALTLRTFSETDTPGPALASYTWFGVVFHRSEEWGGGHHGFCPEADIRQSLGSDEQLSGRPGSTRVELGVQVLPSSERLSEFPANTMCGPTSLQDNGWVVQRRCEESFVPGSLCPRHEAW